MKLTEAKLKQLILEQMSEFELGNFIALLEELQVRLPENSDILVGLHESGGDYINFTSTSKVKESFQAAIDSLDRESKGNATDTEWDHMVIEKLIRTSDYGSIGPFSGNVMAHLYIERNGNKWFDLTQFDEEGFPARYKDEPVIYFEGDEISTTGLVDLMASPAEDILEMLNDFINTYGTETQDSALL